jgi:hypothetical protein
VIADLTVVPYKNAPVHDHLAIQVSKRWLSFRAFAGSFNPDNSPDSQELGGTGFPACAKDTLLFKVIKFAVIFQQVILYFKKFMN